MSGPSCTFCESHHFPVPTGRVDRRACAQLGPSFTARLPNRNQWTSGRGPSPVSSSHPKPSILNEQRLGSGVTGPGWVVPALVSYVCLQGGVSGGLRWTGAGHAAMLQVLSFLPTWRLGPKRQRTDQGREKLHLN
jgi:hypothetical protein